MPRTTRIPQLNFTIQPTDRRIRDHEPTHICSRCGGQIPESDVPLMLFVNEGRDGMYVYCSYCTEQVGFWSHEHYPDPQDPRLCAECEYPIVEIDGQWKIAPPSPLQEITQ